MHTYYHGTADVLIPSIKTEGLIPGKGKGADAWSELHTGQPANVGFRAAKPGVYIAGKEQAEQFAKLAAEVNPGSKPVLIKLAIPSTIKLERDERMPFWNASVVHAPIPPQYIVDVEPVTDTGPSTVYVSKPGDPLLQLLNQLVGDDPIADVAAAQPGLVEKIRHDRRRGIGI